MSSSAWRLPESAADALPILEHKLKIAERYECLAMLRGILAIGWRLDRSAYRPPPGPKRDLAVRARVHGIVRSRQSDPTLPYRLQVPSGPCDCQRDNPAYGGCSHH